METRFERARARQGSDLCFHEAGHAVAAALRGQGRFDTEVLSAAAWRDPVAACLRWEQAPSTARPFIAYGGPWAQARATWERVGGPGGDAEGLGFADHLSRAMLARPEDASGVAVAEFDVASLLRTGGVDDAACSRVLRGVEFAWRRELEDVWPVVVEVALALDRGTEVHLSDVRRLADERVAALYC